MEVFVNQYTKAAAFDPAATHAEFRMFTAEIKSVVTGFTWIQPETPQKVVMIVKKNCPLSTLGLISMTTDSRAVMVSLKSQFQLDSFFFACFTFSGVTKRCLKEQLAMSIVSVIGLRIGCVLLANGWRWEEKGDMENMAKQRDEATV